MTETLAFHGTKIVLLMGRSMVTLLRDDDLSIDWPGHWDLPGGGREGDEDAESCILRETREETGIELTRADLIWRHCFPDGAVWFAAQLPAARACELRMGSEGQRIELVDPAEWIMRSPVIPHFPVRVAFAMEALLGA